MTKWWAMLASICVLALIAVVGAILVSPTTESSAYQVTRDEDWLPKGQQGIDWYIAASGEFGTEYQIRIHRRAGGPKQWIAHGPVEIRDGKGVLVVTGYFSNGKRHGKWITWATDRSTKGVATWNHGIIGDEVRYDQNGNRIAVITYLDNKPQKATHYSPDGQVSSVVDYKDGTVKSFSNGQLTDIQPLN